MKKNRNRDKANMFYSTPFASYISSKAGIWQNINENLLCFSEIMKGCRKNGILVKNIESWVNTLQQGKDVYKDQNIGKVLFENLIAKGNLNSEWKGIRNPIGNDPYIDILTNCKKHIQAKYSATGNINSKGIRDLFTGKYSPQNGVYSTVVNDELFNNIKHSNNGFVEIKPGELFRSSDNSRVINSHLKAREAEKLWQETLDYAAKNKATMNLSRHIQIQSLKASGWAALTTLLFSSVVCYHQVKAGKMRPDDAFDKVIGNTITSSFAAGISTLGTSTLFVAVGAPVVGIGMFVSGIAIGLPLGILVAKTVDKAFSSIFNELMGGKEILKARKQSVEIAALLEQLELINNHTMEIESEVVEALNTYESINVLEIKITTERQRKDVEGQIARRKAIEDMIIS